MTTATAQVRERAAGWAAGAREIVLGLAVFAVYLLVTHGLSQSLPVANAHGRDLLRVEDWLHLAAERPLNHALTGHAVLGALAAWEYAVTYIVTTFGVLAWAWWRRPEAYPWARNTLIISTLIAIACFALWPATPPRLLPGTSFVDIVSIHHPPGSWGSGTVSAGADQLAAMPSLHIGWAVWVTAVTLRSHASRTGIGLGGLHLLVTALVVLATANHYLLDVFAGVALVVVTIGLESVRGALLGPSAVPVRAAAPPRRRAAAAAAPPAWQRVAAEDAFFLYVESPAVPQHVGGIALLAGAPSLASVRTLVGRRLPRLPRLSQRVDPPGRFRRPRWRPAERVDLDWHVQQVRLGGGGGRAELNAFVAGVAERPLDRNRPLWRMWIVHGVAPGESAVVVVLHHAIADGLGVVDILRQLLDPVLPLPGDAADRRPGVLVRAAATTTGLAQLAADGFAQRLPVNAPLSGRRAFCTLMLPLATAREAARAAGTRVTDLLLAAVGEALAGTLAADPGWDAAGRQLRAAVPMTLRPPAPPGTGRRAVPGNLTAALRLDVPLEPMPVGERLRRTAAAAESRRRSGRPLASAAVMRLLGLLPPPLHAALARTIYRSRFFTVIATNMPGPDVPLGFAGADLLDVYPLVPMADEVPLAVGTLGWNGRLCVSLTVDPARLPDPEAFTARVAAAFAELGVVAEQGTTSPC